MLGEREKIRDILNALAETRDAFVKLNGLLSSGPAEYWFEKIGDYADGVFAFSKFKVGDKVALVSDYEGGASGWAGSKHFLKKGAVATIDDVAFGKTGFTYGIVFDNETYIHPFTFKPEPVSSKHQYLVPRNRFTVGERPDVFTYPNRQARC